MFRHWELSSVEDKVFRFRVWGGPSLLGVVKGYSGRFRVWAGA